MERVKLKSKNSFGADNQQERLELEKFKKIRLRDELMKETNVSELAKEVLYDSLMANFAYRRAMKAYLMVHGPNLYLEIPSKTIERRLYLEK